MSYFLSFGFAAAALRALYSVHMALARSTVALLTLLRATTEQDDQGIAVAAEIDAVGGPPIDAVLADGSDPLHAGRVTYFEPQLRGGDLGRGLRIKPPEPASIRAGAVLPDIFNNLKRHSHI
jgi:hypothetical protein